MMRSFTKRILFSTIFFLTLSCSSFAAHIIGSDITVQRLSANNYRVTVNFFRDCSGGGAGFPGTGAEALLYVGVYDKVTHGQQQVITFGAPTITTLAKGDACYVPTLCVERGVYIVDVVIANNPNGYYLSWLRCCRNAVISNIVTPGSVGSVFYAEIPDPAIVNSTPVFNTVPQGTQSYMCATYMNYVDFSATDADGDLLVYSLETPLSCNPTCSSGFPNPNSTGVDNLPGPYGTITWNPGYSAVNPMGDPSTAISSTTGMFSVTPPALGVYVMTVKVEEWRSGVKIGEIRRDFQFEVLTCQRLNISVVPTTTVCIGQVATLTGTGALPGWTYSWNGGAQIGPTATGMSMVNGITTFTATASNGINCIMNTGSFLTNSPSAVVAPPAGNVCLGQNTTLTASGGGTYSWLPGGNTNAVLTGVANGTYTVTVTNGNNCTSQTTGVVYQAPVLTSTVAATSLPCTGNPGSATITASNGSPGYSYVWSSGGQTTSAATGLGTGTHTVTVTDSRSCTSVKTFSISVTASPTASMGSNPSGCSVANGTGTATPSGGGGAPYTYLWGNGQTTQTATGLAAGGNYSVTVTSSNGCTTTNTVSVAALAAPTVSVTSTAGGCGVSIGSATANPSGGSPGYNYSWQDGQTTSTATGLATGNYSVTVTDLQGCTASATVSVSAPGAPAVSNISASSFGCSNPYGVATVSVFGGTPGYNFVWSPGGQTTQTATGLTTGNYSVVVTDANNCSVSSTVSVTVNASPVATASSSQATCGNNNGTASASFTGGTPPYTYSWSNGGTSSAISNLAPGNYSVTISDNSCNVSGIELVTNGDFSAGDVGFSSTYTVCVPSCAEGSYAVGPDASAVHAAWTACADHTSGTGNFMIVNGAGTPGTDVWCQNVSVTPNTNYTFSAWVVSQYTISPSQLQFSINGTPLCAVFSAPSSLCTWTQFFCTWNSGANTSANICILNQNTTLGGNDFGLDDISFQSCMPCTATASVTITPIANLTTATSQTNLLCNGVNTGSATVNPVTGSPSYTYNWSSGQTTSAITGIAAGNYSVTVTDAVGCTSTNSFTITQPTVLSSSTTQTPILCNGGTATAAVAVAGGTLPYTYLWNPTAAATATATGLLAGNYSVTITDANGCTSTNALSITQPALLTSTTTQSAILCNGGTSTAAVAVAGGTLPYTYLWNPTAAATATATGLAAGNYSVTVTDANGCTGTNTLSITQPTPIVLSGACNDSICSGDTTSLSVIASGGTPTYTYVWLPGPMTGPTISVNPAASTTYSVIMTDANGCVSAVQICSVSVLPAPNALFDTLSNGMYGATYSFGDLSSGGTAWFWDFGDGNTSSLQSPIHTFPGSGTYTVTQIVYNQFGCPDTFVVVLDFKDGIIIPNVFTPDGDGINDVWFIPNSGLREFHVDIFDRWGLKVFETTADEIRWDGHSTAGKLLTDGTYFYVLKAVLKSFNGDKDYSTTGYVTLLTQTRKQ